MLRVAGPHSIINPILEMGFYAMLVIDRFEGDYAVCECETGEFVRIRRGLIADDAHEGDILVWTDSAYLVDSSQTKSRSRRVHQKLNRLFTKKSPPDRL